MFNQDANQKKRLFLFQKTILIEAPVGVEPTNKGFADLRLRPLGYSATKKQFHSKKTSAGRSRPPEAGCRPSP